MSRKLIVFVMILAAIFGLFNNRVDCKNLVSKYKDQPISNHQQSDLDTASSHHYDHPGRVQIKVYRGPEHDNHASHGYWVRQPADHY